MPHQAIRHHEQKTDNQSSDDSTPMPQVEVPLAQLARKTEIK
jgi:hypothetical protein